MAYRKRILLFVLYDSLLLWGAAVIGGFLIGASIMSSSISFLFILVSYYLFSFYYSLYKQSWEYISIIEAGKLLKVISVSAVSGAALYFIFQQHFLLSLFITQWMAMTLSLYGARVFMNHAQAEQCQVQGKVERTLIIGAGSAGTMLTRQLLKNAERELIPVAFIDDDEQKWNMEFYGVFVYGGLTLLNQAVKELCIDNIVIAIPSLKANKLKNIFDECMKTKVKTRILPKLEDIITGRVEVSKFQEVQVEDLLGRDTVDLNLTSIASSVTNKVVLVTGAGGSIGSEICRQIACFHPSKLVLLGHGENSIYAIEMELKDTFWQSGIEFVTEIADIQDEQKMLDVMYTHRPSIVYHAAAHKHVPLMERNPEEAVKNNIIGTINTAKAASWSDVQTFVMISSDKAVNPTSVMGATKRLAEMIVQSMNRNSTTRFVTVRFGNVLGSRGSVIPLFKKQIERGGPVTVTHPDMERYFMTIPEASRLVIQAGVLAKGGEIFILDMGEPVKIVDLAKNLITLSGYSLDDIEIEFTGVRSGEKLFEELLNSDETEGESIYHKIYIGKTNVVNMGSIKEIVENYAVMDKETLRFKLLQTANNRMEKNSLEIIPS